MTRNATNLTLERLLATDWANDETRLYHAKSRARLMAEYLRRTALWAEAVGTDHDWPFTDIAIRIAPDVRAESDVLKQLDGIAKYLRFAEVRRSAEYMLHWAAVLDAPHASKPDLPDPYEPLLMIFERGGAFNIENRFIDLILHMLPIKTWREGLTIEPLSSLNSESLDALDQSS